jgi:hypothetical protein
VKRLTARLFFVFLFLLVSFLIFKPAVYAQEQIQAIQPQPIQQAMSNTNPDVPKNLHTFTQNVMIEVMSAMICQISGIDVTNTSQSCLGVDPQTKKIGFVKNGGGLIGVLQNSIITMYTPPLHTGDYFKYLASNFGISKPSYAATPPQDAGFASINTLTSIWLASRNVAYLFFVLIFLIIGIGIMLRIHIDPRTVMTIQNQIPKIIIALVLVTFSFAIAGLLIDLMYVISYLLLGIIGSSDACTTSKTVNCIASPASFVFQLVSSGNPFDAANNALTTHGGAYGLWDLAWQPANAASGFVSSMLDNPGGRLITTFLGGIIGYVIAHTIATATSGLAGMISGIVMGIAVLATGATEGAAGPMMVAAPAISNFITGLLTTGGAIAGAAAGPQIVGAIGGTITFLIVLCAVLVTLFRLWFQLIMAYIQVLISIVFAPIWIMLGLIPTSKISFSTWIRNLVGNLSCFPTALVMFLMARVFTDALAGNPTVFAAPMVGNPGDGKIFAAIIGIGIFLMTPSAVTQVKNAISGSSGITFGGIGAGLSSGAAVPMAGIKGVAAVNMKTQVPGEAAGLGRGLAKMFGIGP